MNPLRLLDRVRRRILVHRRVLGAGCAAAAVWLLVQAATAPPPQTVLVWTAARDLPSGVVLTRDDLARTGFAPGSAPAHAIGSLRLALGRTLATPLGTGEPLTPAHLVGVERLIGYPGRAAVAVRIPDPAVAALLSPGQRVALVASDPQGARPPERIVEDAAVLAVPRASSNDAGPGALGGRLVVFAVPADEADDVASAGASRYLSVVWSR
ncbi:MAG TPA: SAF domain-containing protein [Marmoricola sp.]|nr:SAF domain-containing protein [Marmoricola sp.]